jgi:hypothetical protein
MWLKKAATVKVTMTIGLLSSGVASVMLNERRN